MVKAKDKRPICQFCKKEIGFTEACTVIRHNWTCTDCTYAFDNNLPIVPHKEKPKRKRFRRPKQERLFNPTP